MRIGFIGASAVAQTISKHVLPYGHQVVLSNSRGPDSLASLVEELGTGAKSGTPQDAAEQDLVVLAVNWSSVQAALFSIADWRGRILVDATNRLASYSPLTLGDILGRTSSEIVADLAPGARVVKAFIPYRCLGSPIVRPLSPARFYASPETTTKPRSRSRSSSSRPAWISAR